MASRKPSTGGILKELRAFGLAYPGAHTKSPWPGHLDLAVNDKTFAYLSLEGQPLSISCKLPTSHEAALMLSFTTPTGYGLAKSGWVTATFAKGETPPVDLLKAWLDESYRAQAPKRLVKQLPTADAITPAPSKKARKSSVKRAVKSKTSSRSVQGKVRRAKPRRAPAKSRATPSRTSNKRLRPPPKPTKKRKR
jgi:predicted DNA-binding protein (MmcQ/YjbR family)